jgi:hypothetical protein
MPYQAAIDSGEHGTPHDDTVSESYCSFSSVWKAVHLLIRPAFIKLEVATRSRGAFIQGGEMRPTTKASSSSASAKGIVT